MPGRALYQAVVVVALASACSSGGNHMDVASSGPDAGLTPDTKNGATLDGAGPKPDGARPDTAAPTIDTGGTTAADTSMRQDSAPDSKSALAGDVSARFDTFRPSDTEGAKDVAADGLAAIDSRPAPDAASIPTDVAPAKATLYIGPKGNDSNAGTQEAPLATIGKAASQAQPGTLIYMLAGTYPLAAPVNVSAPAGTASDPIRLWATPGAEVRLDFSGATGAGKGLSINVSYWHVKGLIVENCPGRGIQVMKGDHITIENCETRYNGDMGLVVSEGASNALILNCDSHHNFDVENNGENADGFGAKSNLGEGTIFRGCRAWANSDDGWDLYNCPTSVRFENCWAYKNGENFKNLASFAGDGNGFKLGKSTGSNAHHVLVNSMAWGNLGGNGFEDNDNASGLTFYNCVAYNNPKAGYEAINVTTHILKNNISYKNGKPDNILAGSTVSNNSWNDLTVADADFVSLDDSVAVGPRKADGSLPDSNFLKLANGSGLIDKGVDVGLSFKGAAPDLGAFECR